MHWGTNKAIELKPDSNSYSNRASAKEELKEYKIFIDGLVNDGLINKKEGYTLKLKDGELFIIDFKTGEESEKHRKQLEKYEVLLFQIHGKKAKSYLLYIEKNKIIELIKDGKSDKEIKEYIASRFGNSVLYNPGFNQDTYILWIAPFVILLIALSTYIFRRKV